MTRLLSLTFSAAVAAALGLYIVDGVNAAVEQINTATASRCATYNSVLPGACQMP